jgi:hypothetical protein
MHCGRCNRPAAPPAASGGDPEDATSLAQLLVLLLRRSASQMGCQWVSPTARHKAGHHANALAALAARAAGCMAGYVSCASSKLLWTMGGGEAIESPWYGVRLVVLLTRQPARAQQVVEHDSTMAAVVQPLLMCEAAPVASSYVQSHQQASSAEPDAIFSGATVTMDALPDDVLQLIAASLDPPAIKGLRHTCKRLAGLLANPDFSLAWLWRRASVHSPVYQPSAVAACTRHWPPPGMEHAERLCSWAGQAHDDACSGGQVSAEGTVSCGVHQMVLSVCPALLEWILEGALAASPHGLPLVHWILEHEASLHEELQGGAPPGPARRCVFMEGGSWMSVLAVMAVMGNTARYRSRCCPSPSLTDCLDMHWCPPHNSVSSRSCKSC